MDMNKNKIIYSLSIEDIQTVAEDAIDRELNASELKRIVEKLPDYIPWFDCIESALLDIVKTPEEKE